MTSPGYHLPPISVYAYKLGHMASQQVSSRTKIKLVNEKKGQFHLKEKGGHPLTEYDIIIDDPSALGFKHAEGEVALQNRIYDLILAINLELRKVVMCPTSLKPPGYTWLTNGNTNGKGGAEIVRIKEQVSAMLGMGKPERLNTIHVKNNLEMIDKLDRHNKHKRINQRNYRKKANLEKALELYESELIVRGRNEIDKISMFRTISAVIEIAINWDKELSSADQIKEFSKLARISIRMATAWRNLYPRSKHADDSHTKQKRNRMLQRISLLQVASYRSNANSVLLECLKKL
jgi:hypothetical protein